MEDIVIREKDGYPSSVKKRKDTVLKLRNSTLDDLDSIMGILADGRAYLALQGIEQWQGYYPQKDTVTSDILRGESFLVEDENGRPSGTAVLGFEGEEDYQSIQQGAWLMLSDRKTISYAVIHRVAVRKDTRGTGVSDFLLNELEKVALNRCRKSIRVDTHPRNIAMRKLLENHGYNECGVVWISHAEEFDPRRVAYEKVL